MRRRVAALILAAGSGSRMGGPVKLLAVIEGEAMVLRVARAAVGSRAMATVVVTGHAAEVVTEALAGLPVVYRHNPDHAEGLSSSLRTGIMALPDDADGVLVLLADMPFVTAAALDRLVDAFEAVDGGAVIVPVHAGRRGNPVLWPRHFFGELCAIAGDKGGRELLSRPGMRVVEVEAGPEIAIDLDTPDAVRAHGGQIG